MQGGREYLLDTAGVKYLLARGLENLSAETEALDIHGINNKSLLDSIGEFTNLKVVLAYWGGRVKGPTEIVPRSISRLRKLKHLDLRNNQIHSIEADLGLLENLEFINLSANKLETFPSGLLRLYRIKWIDISGNSISTLPDRIGSLTSLEVFDISGNQMDSLPPSITDLTNLKRLSAANCGFMKIPDSIGKLQNLEYLALQGNKPGLDFSKISSLSNLRELNISSNRNSLLPKFESLTMLRHIDLGGMNLTQFPEGITKLHRLKTLNVSLNQLTSLPREIGRLRSLEVLNLSDNRILMLPDEIGQLSSLEQLYIYGSWLKVLPQGIAGLSKLEILDLAIIDPPRNQLSSIPSEIGNLLSLRRLNLIGHEITRIPPEIGNLKQLLELDMGDNPLVFIPNEMVNLHNLEYFDFSGHRLDEIPSFLCEMENLEIDHIPYSRASVHIPDCFLSNISKHHLLYSAQRFLRDSLYTASYEIVNHLLGRFPDTSEQEKAKLLTQLDELSAAGVQHEALTRLRARLELEEE